MIKALIGENVMLKDRVRKLEIELAEAQQYQRRSNVVITGIPTNIEDEKVESTVIDIFKTIDVNISPRDIEESIKWLKANMISLNTSKTELLLFKHPNKNVNFNIKLK